MKLTNQILEVLEQMYIREDGIVRAEIEYILMLNYDIKQVNKILNN